MPIIETNGIKMHYTEQGEGDLDDARIRGLQLDGPGRSGPAADQQDRPRVPAPGLCEPGTPKGHGPPAGEGLSAGNRG